jgi:hypothetical protein
MNCKETRMWTAFIWAQYRVQYQALVNMGCIKGGEFLDWLNEHELLKDSTPWS